MDTPYGTSRPGAAASDRTPLLPDQLAAMQNIPAQGRVPQALYELISPRALATVAAEQAERIGSLERIRVGNERVALSLPTSVSLVRGLPGGELRRSSRSEIESMVAATDSLDGMRPDWAPVHFHPNSATARRQPILRRYKGSRVMPHYVFGNDDRQPYYPSGYPWLCIGQLYVWADASAPDPQFSGSAALAGRNFVVTASHMVPWDSGDGNWMAKFVPADYDGQSTLGSGVFSWVERAHGIRDHSQGDDIAIMKLFDPLGDWLGYFGTKRYSDDWEDAPYWTLAGYPGAVANGMRPSRQSGISVLDDDSEGDGLEIEHNGDASPGDSGGPLFAWWNDGPYLIGVHSGGEEEYQFPIWVVENNVAAGGNLLNKIVRWGRENW